MKNTSLLIKMFRNHFTSLFTYYYFCKSFLCWAATDKCINKSAFKICISVYFNDLFVLALQFAFCYTADHALLTAGRHPSPATCLSRTHYTALSFNINIMV